MEKKRVLLVDDERNSLLIAGKFLSHLGYQYEETTSGANALEKVEKGGYHLVLLDHEMPEMNGVETAKKIRALSTEQRNIPIIMLTAHIRRKVLDSYKGVGVNDYLIKPFDPSELKEMIERYSWEAKPSTPMQSNSGVSQYQFIKLDYISRLSNGDRSFTKEMLQTISQDLPILYQNLEKNWNAQDLEEFKHSLHKLNSPLSTIGMTNLNPSEFLMYATHQRAFSQQGKQQLKALHSLILKALEEIKEELAKL